MSHSGWGSRLALAGAAAGLVAASGGAGAVPLPTGSTTRVSVPPGADARLDWSTEPVASDDGSVIAFASSSSLHFPQEAGGYGHVVTDSRTGHLVRYPGTSGPAALSGDGRWFAASWSDERRTVLYRVGDVARTPFCEDVPVPGTADLALNRDGTVVVFATGQQLLGTDTNRHLDVYACHVPSGRLDLVSVDADGGAADGPSGAASQAWRGTASGPAGVGTYVAPHAVGVSGDGRWVTFSSAARDLVAGDRNDSCLEVWDSSEFGTHSCLDVFVHDRRTGTTELVSRATDAAGGAQGDLPSGAPSISDDGRYVAFSSAATNLSGQWAASRDGAHSYVRDRSAGTTVHLSSPTSPLVQPTGTPVSTEYGGFGTHVVSRDGAYVGVGPSVVYDRVTRVAVFVGDRDAFRGGMTRNGNAVVFEKPGPGVEPTSPGSRSVYRTGFARARL